MSEVRGSGHECQAATAKKWQKVATPHPRSGVAARRNYAVSEVRGGSGEEQTHVQGVVATKGPRGAITYSRSGGAVVRRYSSSKVRSRGCALLD